MEAINRRDVAVAAVENNGVGIIHRGTSLLGGDPGTDISAWVVAGRAHGYGSLLRSFEAAEDRFVGPAAIHYVLRAVVFA